jgi:glycosyltransferase involved in cell wall biosynthesis
MRLTSPRKIFVWQWGRFGSGPRFAFELEQALAQYAGYTTSLSLAEGAELMQSAICREAVDMPLRTYAGPFDFIRRSLNIRNVLRPLLKKLEADPPDAAIVPMLGYWDIVFMRALRRMGVPVISMVHDVEVHPGDHFHLMVQLQRRMFRMSQGIVTLTDFVARQLEAYVPLNRKAHATIPHPAFAFPDLDLPSPAPVEIEANRPFRLLLAGRLRRYKGLELLGEAARRVTETRPLRLRVVGAAQDAGVVETLRTLPGIEFDLGWKTDGEIIAHLDWADAAVLPYVEASQSGVAPLSLARGRPVIATPVGGLPEQVRDGETGIITDSSTPDALAGAILKFAADRAFLRRCSENALRFAQSELGWESLAPRYAKLVEDTAARGV